MGELNQCDICHDPVGSCDCTCCNDREEEDATASLRAALSGAVYCIDNHYGISGSGPCDCDQATLARKVLSK